MTILLHTNTLMYPKNEQHLQSAQSSHGGSLSNLETCCNSASKCNAQMAPTPTQSKPAQPNDDITPTPLKRIDDPKNERHLPSAQLSWVLTQHLTANSIQQLPDCIAWVQVVNSTISFARNLNLHQCHSQQAGPTQVALPTRRTITL